MTDTPVCLQLSDPTNVEIVPVLPDWAQNMGTLFSVLEKKTQPAHSDGVVRVDQS